MAEEEDRDEIENLVVKTRQILERAHLARLGDGPGWWSSNQITEIHSQQLYVMASVSIQDLLVPCLPEDYPDENAS